MRIVVLFLSAIIVTNDAMSENQELLCVVDGNHSYDEIADKKIRWSDVFDVMSFNYLVYIYSPICGHCLSIKNLVIGTALCKSDDMYFVMSSPEVIIAQDVGKTIGAKSISELWINGYPTLLRIDTNVLAMNIAGATAISDYLTN